MRIYLVQAILYHAATEEDIERLGPEPTGDESPLLCRNTILLTAVEENEDREQEEAAAIEQARRKLIDNTATPDGAATPSFRAILLTDMVAYFFYHDLLERSETVPIEFAAIEQQSTGMALAADILRATEAAIIACFKKTIEDIESKEELQPGGPGYEDPTNIFSEVLSS